MLTTTTKVKVRFGTDVPKGSPVSARPPVPDPMYFMDAESASLGKRFWIGMGILFLIGVAVVFIAGAF